MVLKLDNMMNLTDQLVHTAFIQRVKMKSNDREKAKADFAIKTLNDINKQRVVLLEEVTAGTKKLATS